MEIDRTRQAQALAKAKEIIAEAEQKREAVRVEKGIQSFLLGKFDVLQNDELVENFASYILDKYISDEQDAAVKVLQKLGRSLCSDNIIIRERSLMVISVFTEIILEEDFAVFREILARILVDWLKFETEYIAGFEFVCSQLQKIILAMLYSGQWNELENLIIILYQIGNGVIVKNNLIRGMTAKVHENLAEPDILDRLVNVYLDETDDRRVIAESLLIHLGRLAAAFLVQKLIYSNNKDDRFILLDLIPKTGKISTPVLVDCLRDEPPWFAIRNIILIISRLNDPGLYQVIEPYLTHKDIRVQQQVINCIETLGGKQMRKRLIGAMMLINDELKGQLIAQLGQFEGKDVGNAFLDLLEQRNNFASHVRHDLLLKLCVKLKFYPSQRAIEALKELVVERKDSFGDADKIVRAAATSLQAIEIKIKEDDKETSLLAAAQPSGAIEDLDLRVLPVDSIPAPPEAEMSGAEELFSTDEMNHLSAGSEIPGLSTDALEEGNQKLGQDQPFYSSQDHHLTVWSKFYEQMSTEEVNEIFALLRPVTYQENDEIIRQGTKTADLFFIDNGFAGISHVGEESEILLTSLQAGELIGAESFVKERAWSVSLHAQTELQVRILEKEKFTRLSQKMPSLENKLYYYCNHYDVLPYLISLTDDDAVPPIEKTLIVQSSQLFFNETGELVDEVVSGTLQYVARGGYCFTMPYMHEENPARVLGRQVASIIDLNDGTRRRCFGVIAGAGTHDHNDRPLFLYVKFYHPLEKADYTCNSLELM